MDDDKNSKVEFLARRPESPVPYTPEQALISAKQDLQEDDDIFIIKFNRNENHYEYYAGGGLTWGDILWHLERAKDMVLS